MSDSPATSPTPLTGSAVGPVTIRPRTSADLPGCVDLVRATYRSDGYPRYLADATAEFLAPAAETDAWVAERDGEILGHVGLHDAAGDVTYPVAHEATGRPADQLAVVARLFVSSRARGLGLGRRLLELAARTATDRGRRAVLDVVQDALGPIAVYEKAGWSRIGAVTLELGGGRSLDLWVYLGPEG